MSEQQTAPSTVAAASKASSTPPSPVQYIHHLKFPVADLDRSVTFYEKVFNAHQHAPATGLIWNEQGTTHDRVSVQNPRDLSC